MENHTQFNAQSHLPNYWLSVFLLCYSISFPILKENMFSISKSSVSHQMLVEEGFCFYVTGQCYKSWV